MYINLTSDYAVRCLITLAAEGKGMNSAMVAERIGVTRALTTNILRRLRTGGLVNSDRGARGGYYLGKEKHEISLLDILHVMEDSVYINRCLDPEEDCARHSEEFHPVRDYYQFLQDMIHDSLSNMTLDKLLEEAETVL